MDSQSKAHDAAFVAPVLPFLYLPPVSTVGSAAAHGKSIQIRGEVQAAVMLEPGRRVAELKSIYGDS